MMKLIKKIFGIKPATTSDIISNLTRTVSKLEAVADASYEEIRAARDVEEEAIKRRLAASDEAARALRISGNISALLGD